MKRIGLIGLGNAKECIRHYLRNVNAAVALGIAA